VPKDQVKVVCQNKKAYHDYFIEDKFESGIVLTGTEIKSVRGGKVNIQDSYCTAKDGEMFIINMHISPFEQGNRYNHEPTRTRKLLLHKREIGKLVSKQSTEGYALIPLRVYLVDGFAKLEIGVAKGKKDYDKREDLKEKDAKREMEKFKKSRYSN
jgi:SsrA-binding protein